MKEDIPTITTLHDLVDYDARKLASAERQLESILPDWINKAGSVTLKNILQQYLDFVKKQNEKVQDFVNDENINSLSRINHVMQSFIIETRERVNSCTDMEVQDACLLASIQGINHYKISMYGTAAAFAKALGNDKYAVIFHEAEMNEKQIDEKLSLLAEHEINNKARSPIVLPNKS